MNWKPAAVGFMALLTTLVSYELQAQERPKNVGFQMGQVQPQPAVTVPATSNLIQGVMTSPIQGTANSPVLPLGGGISQPNSSPLVTHPLGTKPAEPFFILPWGVTVYVPTGTLVVESNSTTERGAYLTAPATPQTPPSPNGSGRGGTSIDRPSRSANPSTTPADITRLELGTPREKVIEKYGNPVAYIMNMNGETLYFGNGVVVFLKDGVISAPGRQDFPTRP